MLRWTIDYFSSIARKLRRSFGACHAREVVREHPVREQQRLLKSLVRFLLIAECARERTSRVVPPTGIAAGVAVTPSLCESILQALLPLLRVEPG